MRLTVSDTGCGMDPATAAKIFEPFFTTKPVGAGTGLGLSTVYGIVKQHDGFIWAYSEPGIGTVMKIYLPAATAGAARDVVEEAPIPERSGRMESAIVLVVEDEPSVRNLVRRSLEGVGLTVAEAENGRQALELVATMPEPPALVLSDVIMPGLNGRELSEALALTQPDVPVLFMSGYTGDDVLARSLLPAIGALHPEAVRAGGAGRPRPAAPREHRRRAALAGGGAQRGVQRAGRARVERQPFRRRRPWRRTAAELEVPPAHRPLIQHEAAARQQEPARQHLVRERGGGIPGIRLHAGIEVGELGLESGLARHRGPPQRWRGDGGREVNLGPGLVATSAHFCSGPRTAVCGGC